MLEDLEDGQVKICFLQLSGSFSCGSIPFSLVRRMPEEVAVQAEVSYVGEEQRASL